MTRMNEEHNTPAIPAALPSPRLLGSVSGLLRVLLLCYSVGGGGMAKRHRTGSAALMILSACLGATAIACTSPLAPLTIANGEFVLSKYGTTPVPTNLFQLPDQNAQPTSCWYTLSSGSLTLTAASHTVHYSIVYRNSCDGSILYNEIVSGRFTQTDGTLVFYIPSQNGEHSFPGTITVDTVALQPDALFVFDRET
jgi:hypothetical protein